MSMFAQFAAPLASTQPAASFGGISSPIVLDGKIVPMIVATDYDTGRNKMIYLLRARSGRCVESAWKPIEGPRSFYKERASSG